MGSKRELEEIEVDVNLPTPLSKKQKRLVKKGKTVVAEPKPLPEEPKKGQQPLPRSQYAVWIGNMNFDTTPTELREFIIEHTEKSQAPVQAEDITRLKMPAKKGFAYVDVKTEDQMKTLIALSESRLGGRSLLIKDARSFEGRPAPAAESKNPPSRILFVGNLSFDTTDQELEMHFQHCGTIQRIRTATFEDTGKCKGFTFIDFVDEESATKALNDKRCRKLNGRALRMEYGEDRSKRRPKQLAPRQHEQTESHAQSHAQPERSFESAPRADRPDRADRADRSDKRDKKDRKPKERRSRPTPGAALMSAERAKQSVVPSTGKKVTFD